MPRYFFHLRNDIEVDDEEGQELPNLEEARERARKFAVAMAATSVAEHQKITLDHRIEVTDESGSVVETVHFGDVVKIEG